MFKAAAVCLLAASATAAPAKGSKTLKMKKNMRSIKSDHARVVKHLNALLEKAPEMHKAGLKKEAERLAASSSDYTDLDSYFAYPMTLDWIVDLYFEDSDDATAYPVIIDSGSSNLAVAISSCTNCGEAATTLDPTLVSDPEMCIEVTYGSGEWSGVEVASSYVSLGSGLGVDATYAGITYQDDFFEGGSSYVGILGMAYEGIANSYEDDCTTTTSSSSSSSSRSATRGAQKKASTGATASTAAAPLLYTMYDNGVVDFASFAVAMCDDDDATVSVGGLDHSLVAGSMNYAETQKTFGEYYGYYLVYTTGVAVGDTAVTVENINLYGGLVVDTGTTLHYLPTATVKAIETQVTSSVGDSSITSTSFYSWESCVTASDLDSFPDVTYTFAVSSDSDAESFEVVLKPEHYLLEYGSCYYWGFEESSLGIFGNIGMKNKVVDFDVTNNKVGFGNGVCTSTSGYKTAGEMLGEVAAQVSRRSSSELAAGALSAFAVVGTVLASAFVVLNKLASKSAAACAESDAAEAQALLPPL